MSGVSIRRASHADLPALVDALGQREYFVNRLQRQDERRGTLLVAVLDRKIVGDVYVWLDEAEEPEIRRHLKSVPLITHLEVRSVFRGRGIGTALMRAAEALLSGKQHKRVALAVELSNHRTANLYHRMGYRRWGVAGLDTVTCYHDEEVDGVLTSVGEECRVLVKSLSEPQAATDGNGSGHDRAASRPH